ncbi:major facilitator superfamily domain-containing protein, partial [Ochromonadaceae sp. CCMP2298]
LSVCIEKHNLGLKSLPICSRLLSRAGVDSLYRTGGEREGSTQRGREAMLHTTVKLGLQRRIVQLRLSAGRLPAQGLSARGYRPSAPGLALNSRDHTFRVLGLKTFTDEEIAESFRRLGEKDGLADVSEGIAKLSTLGPSMTHSVSKLVVGEHPGVMDLPTYRKTVLALGEKLDPRVWNIGLSFLFTGTSVGVIIPCMPLLVAQLGIPPSEFGLVISAFGLSKLLGNIPSGYLVERYGRKPIMVGGLAMCGVGLGSIGLALLPGFGTPWLVACRFVSGLGVSAFVAGGFMFISDIATPLNRTRTLAPVMAGFSGGAALGPAIGGALIGSIGIASTYATVGAAFAGLAVMNWMLLAETKDFGDGRSGRGSPALNATATTATTATTIITTAAAATTTSVLEDEVWAAKEREREKGEESEKGGVVEEGLQAGLANSFGSAFTSWRSLLLSDPQIRSTVALNG